MPYPIIKMTIVPDTWTYLVTRMTNHPIWGLYDRCPFKNPFKGRASIIMTAAPKQDYYMREEINFDNYL